MKDDEKTKSTLNITATTWYARPVAGYYCLGSDRYGGFHISMPYKPNIIHRLFMRLLLGFMWKDR